MTLAILVIAALTLVANVPPAVESILNLRDRRRKRRPRRPRRPLTIEAGIHLRAKWR
jgi:hypothetical protein